MRQSKTVVRAFALVASAILFVTLTACGGGGGGSSGGSATPTPSELTTLGTRDPFYRTGGGFDTNSGETNAIRTTTEFTVPDGGLALHRRVQGSPTTPSLNYDAPPRDVRDAWSDGWTGQGVNVLFGDEFGLEGEVSADNNDTHGYGVAFAFFQIAPGANLYGVNALPTAVADYKEGGVRAIGSANTNGHANNSDGHENLLFHVLNFSGGSDTETVAPTQENLNTVYATPLFIDVLGTADSFFRNSGDAVIVKAVDNTGGADAGFEYGNVALITHANTGPRSLLVGALNQFGRTGSPATIATYSAHAGANENVQNRFLVEYGGQAFSSTQYLCQDDSTPTTCNDQQTLLEGTEGTSFATPRVAGFAALLRHKFSNLSGAQTAFKLLDTATYEGLTCHPNCDVGVYGQGQVDIGAALAPSGPLQ